MTVKITMTSVMVNDQAKAHDFYTRVMGFVTKIDQPLGEYRWLTVVSEAVPDGPELLLEPIGVEFAGTFQKALWEAGIPATAFGVDDIHAEYARMQALGVVFR